MRLDQSPSNATGATTDSRTGDSDLGGGAVGGGSGSATRADKDSARFATEGAGAARGIETVGEGRVPDSAGRNASMRSSVISNPARGVGASDRSRRPLIAIW